jgi:hypothetical protein
MRSQLRGRGRVSDEHGQRHKHTCYHNRYIHTNTTIHNSRHPPNRIHHIHYLTNNIQDGPRQSHHRYRASHPSLPPTLRAVSCSSKANSELVGPVRTCDCSPGVDDVLAILLALASVNIALYTSDFSIYILTSSPSLILIANSQSWTSKP